MSSRKSFSEGTSRRETAANAAGRPARQCMISTLWLYGLRRNGFGVAEALPTALPD